MYKKITCIYGDGVGPEVTKQSLKVLQTLGEVYGHDFIVERALLGAEAIEAAGMPLPPDTVEKALHSDAVLLGAVGDPRYDLEPNALLRPEQGLLGIRKALQVFASLRPVKVHPSLRHLSPVKNAKQENIDLIVFRELTGGIYFGAKETNAERTMARDECQYSRHEIERVAHLAFQSAMGRRRQLTLVDKSNVLETSRLWRSVVRELSAAYPQVKVDYMAVDIAAMQLILSPGQFDVILTENMFGDIISGEASVLSGSLGLMPSASIGAGTALFEPIHGSLATQAGKDIANPIGSILSTAMMLEHFELNDEATIVREAVHWTLANGFVTKDIDPINFYFTSTVGDLICDYIQGKVVDTVNKSNIELRKSTII